MLGPTEDFEASLAGLLPPTVAAPSSPEPHPSDNPSGGAGLDSLQASPEQGASSVRMRPRRSSARDAAGASRSSAGCPPTTCELEAKRARHAQSETPAQLAERHKLQAQETALAWNDRWQRQHATQARSLSRAVGGESRAEQMMMLTAGGSRRLDNEMLELLQKAKPFYERHGNAAYQMSLRENRERWHSVGGQLSGLWTKVLAQRTYYLPPTLTTYYLLLSTYYLPPTLTTY